MSCRVLNLKLFFGKDEDLKKIQIKGLLRYGDEIFHTTDE